MADNDLTELDTSAIRSDTPQRLLPVLREEVIALMKTVPGPISGVTVRAGDCALEITWSRTDALPAAATAELVRPAQPRAELAEPVPPADEREAGLEAVTAPLVGTFYHAPSPGAAPFVRVGEHIERGQNIGIVEAMKLMNHITSEWAGEVVEIAADDGEAVEFGQSLVLVRPVAG